MKTTSMPTTGLRVSQHALRRAALLCLTALLHACGGGSYANIPGFAGPPPPVVVPPPPVVVPPPPVVVPPPVVTAKNWCGATQIQTVAGEAEDGKAAFGLNGNAIVVWTQGIGESNSVRARSYGQTTDWGTEVALGSGFAQQISSDAHGNIVAAWKQGNDIFANRFVPGTGWGTSQAIEGGTARADSPNLSSDASGNVTAVWSQTDGVIFNIWANRYTPGAGWGTAQLIETDNAGSAYSPSVVTDGSGNVTAVWRQSDGTRYNIWSNRFSPTTGWGTAQLIETDNVASAEIPKIAVAPEGNVVAAWLQYDGTRLVFKTNLYTIGAGWGTATQIPTGGIDINEGTFTLDSNGHILALWTQANAVGSLTGIWANRFVAGTGWGIPQVIESDNSINMSSPRIASDGNGDSIAMWVSEDDGGYSVRTSRYTAAAGWGTAQTLSSSQSYTAYPHLAVDSSGSAMAVWSQDVTISASTQKQMWANSYASTCPASL